MYTITEFQIKIWINEHMFLTSKMTLIIADIIAPICTLHIKQDVLIVVKYKDGMHL